MRDGAKLGDDLGQFGETVLAFAEQAFVLLDADGTVLDADGAAETIFGVSRASLVGADMTAHDVFGPVVSDLIQRVAQRGGLTSLYDHIPKSARETRHFDLTLAPLGTAKRALLTVHPRGQAKALMGQSGRRGVMMAHLSEALAHEIRNPLSGIRAAAQLMGKSLPEEKHHLAEMVVLETGRLASLVSHLESLTDRGVPTLEDLNVHEVIQHVINLMRAEIDPHLTLQTAFDPSLPPVVADRDALVQVLINLVRNAVEAQTNAPATLKVQTRYRQGFRRPDSNQGTTDLPIEIEICDTGPGVPAQLETDLFDPFVTAKEGGKGLGLALVAQLMEDMGGSVRHERAAPTGARFFLNFRRAEGTR